MLVEYIAQFSLLYRDAMLQDVRHEEFLYRIHTFFWWTGKELRIL